MSRLIAITDEDVISKTKPPLPARESIGFKSGKEIIKKQSEANASLSTN